jgi:tetraacyldisaccharide 4'-kinase
MNLPPLVRILLWPLSVLYGGYVRMRARFYAKGWLKQKHLRGKVVSVGNLTVGGTGKTPMVLWLAEKFLAEGKRVAILSRGYRGTGGTSDEIELMKHRLQDRVTFGVGKDRFAEGHRIEQREPIDVFLLDDGFQHLPLARDVDILLIDALRPIHRCSLLPAGSLREPASAIGRADLLVFTRVGTLPISKEAIARVVKYPIFSAATRLVGFRLHGNAALMQSSEISHGPFFAFCGIGNPQGFFDDLSRWEVPVAGESIFRDHHRYTMDDVRRLEKAAQRAGAIAFVTTEKDAENLGRGKNTAIPIFVAVIDFVITGESEFMERLERKLQPERGASA